MISPGAPIALVAPSGIFDPERLAQGMAAARARGLDLAPFPGMLAPHRFLASDDATRRRHLIEALTSPAYAAVWIVRGGYGITRLIGDLPLDRIDARPVIGFSDVTGLFQALWPRGTLVHAPMPHSLPSTDAEWVDDLFDVLAGRGRRALIGESWIEGRVTAPVIVGNLTLFAALCGTKYAPAFRDHVVVLEEIGEVPYRVDRLLVQLRQSGAFEGVAGVAFGDFERCDPPAGASYTLRDVLVDAVRDLGVPVVGGLPVGHGRRNAALVWGERVTLGEGQLIRERVPLT